MYLELKENGRVLTGQKTESIVVVNSASVSASVPEVGDGDGIQRARDVRACLVTRQTVIRQGVHRLAARAEANVRSRLFGRNGLDYFARSQVPHFDARVGCDGHVVAVRRESADRLRTGRLRLLLITNDEPSTTPRSTASLPVDRSNS